MENKFILITSLFNETRVERKKEFIQSLKNNLNNPYIKEIHVFYDISKDNEENEILEFIEKNCFVIFIKDRPSYNDIFNYANKMFPNSRIIIANGDVYFNETLKLLNNLSLKNIFLGLTRWNVLENGELKYFTQIKDFKFITKCKICKNQRYLFTEKDIAGCDYDPPCWKIIDCSATIKDLEILPGRIMDFTGSSQDAWIFETPLEIDFRCYFKLGTQHCDSFLNYHLLKSKLKVFNPSKNIQACHLHLSGIKSEDLLESLKNNARRVIDEYTRGNRRISINPCDINELKKYMGDKESFNR